MDKATRHETDAPPGDMRDVVGGPVGSAYLKDPAKKDPAKTVARSTADGDARPSIEEDDAARPADDRT